MWRTRGGGPSTGSRSAEESQVGAEGVDEPAVLARTLMISVWLVARPTATSSAPATESNIGMFKRYLIVLSVLLALTIAFLCWEYTNVMAANREISEVMDRCPLDLPSSKCEVDMTVALDVHRAIDDAFGAALWAAVGLVSLMLVSSVVRWVIHGARN